MLNPPKILVGTIFSEVKNYCIKDWYKNSICKLTYPSFDFCAIDNSKDPKYHRRIYHFFDNLKKKSHIGELTVIHTPRTHAKSEVFMADSLNALRKHFLENGYDWLLLNECDVYTKPDILERLLSYNMQILSALYFTGEKSYSYPVLTDVHYSFTEKVMVNHSYITGFYHLGEYNKPQKIVNAGLGCCFPIGTKILDSDRKLIEIQNIKIADKVLTHNSNTGLVKNIIQRHYEGNMIGIIPKYFRKPIFVTPEHPILIVKRNELKKDGYFFKKAKPIPIFIKADEINEGDFVCYPKQKVNIGNKIINIKISNFISKTDNIFVSEKFIYSNRSFAIIKNSITKISEKYNISRYLFTKAIKWHRTDIKPYGISENYKNKIIKILIKEKFNFSPPIKKLNNIIKIDKDFCRFYGYYIAEGSAYNYIVNFSFGSTEIEYANEIKKITKKIFGLDATIDIREESNTIQVIICSSILCEFLLKISGKGAFNKHIGLLKELISSGKENLIHFLNAYIDGDGHIRKEYTSMATISETLAHELKEIFLILGKVPTITTKRMTNTSSFILGRKVNVKPSFIITVYNKQKSFYQDQNYYYIPVKISSKKYIGNVYNIEVEKENTYCTESFSVHNCLIYKDVLKQVPFRSDGSFYPDTMFAMDLSYNNIQNYYVPIMCRHENQIWDVQRKMINSQ